jgi:hypothetical protein
MSTGIHSLVPVMFKNHLKLLKTGSVGGRWYQWEGEGYKESI